MKKQLRSEEVTVTETQDGLKITWDECFDPLVLNLLLGFQSMVVKKNEYNPHFYCDVYELGSIKCPVELFHYIVDCEYWSKHFTVYQMNRLIHEIYFEYTF